MRFLATSTMLTLALYCGGVAGQMEWSESGDTLDEFPESPFENLVPTASSARAADGIAFATTGPRCDPSVVKKVTSTESGALTSILSPGLTTLAGLLIDGCSRGWIIKGTRRERGNLNPADAPNGIDDGVLGAYTDCDKTKVTVKGEGKIGNDTAALTATTTLDAEETRGAISQALTATNKNKGYSAPTKTVQNIFYNNGTERTVFWSNQYCSDANLVEAFGSDSDRRFDDFIPNKTNQTTYKNLKAELTFSKDFETIKLFLPKGSGRIPLPGIDGSNKAKAGEVIKSKSIALPLVSKTLAAGGSLFGTYDARDFDFGNSNSSANITVTPKVMSGKETICTAQEQVVFI